MLARYHARLLGYVCSAANIAEPFGPHPYERDCILLVSILEDIRDKLRKRVLVVTAFTVIDPTSDPTSAFNRPRPCLRLPPCETAGQSFRIPADTASFGVGGRLLVAHSKRGDFDVGGYYSGGAELS